MCSRAGKDKEVRAVVLKGEGKVRKAQLNRKLLKLLTSNFNLGLQKQKIIKLYFIPCTMTCYAVAVSLQRLFSREERNVVLFFRFFLLATI